MFNSAMNTVKEIMLEEEGKGVGGVGGVGEGGGIALPHIKKVYITMHNKS